jgi:hypothetical protein
MTYTAQWTNRIDYAQHVQIDLNLTDGATTFRHGSFDIPHTPAQVDQAFLDSRATIAIANRVAEDTRFANIAAFMALNADLSLGVLNATDITTLISRNTLPYTGAQVAGFLQRKLTQFNTMMLREIASQLYG